MDLKMPLGTGISLGTHISEAVGFENHPPVSQSDNLIDNVQHLKHPKWINAHKSASFKL